MSRPPFVILGSLLLALAAFACGQDRSGEQPAGGESAPAVGRAPEASLGPADVSGTYAVEGMTVEKESGRKRAISGTIIIEAEDDGTYKATFALKTTYPTPDGPLPADVIGTGEGKLVGARLEGSAQTQLVMATVPGVDVGFAFVPRYVGPRLVSTSRGTVAADGTLTIEVENEGLPGEVYPPTHTTLRGKRVAEAGESPTSE